MLGRNYSVCVYVRVSVAFVVPCFAGGEEKREREREKKRKKKEKGKSVPGPCVVDHG